MIKVHSGDRRSFKCPMCDKAYIGQGSLNRHYRMMPSHDPNGDSSLAPTPPGSTAVGTVSSDSLLNEVRARDAKKYLGWYWSRGRCRKNATKRRGRTKGRPTLRELLNCYSNEELLQDGMSELTKVAGTWQFLDTKCKQQQQRPYGQPTSDNYFSRLYEELEIVSENTSSMSRQYLEPCVATASMEGAQSNRLRVMNEAVAKLLGVPVGTYAIKKLDSEETPTPSPVPQLSTIDLTNTTESVDSAPSSVRTPTSTSSSRYSLVPETDEDSRSSFPGTQSHGSPVSCATDRVVSPILEYSNWLSNLTLTPKDDTESTASASVYADSVTEDDDYEDDSSATEPPDDSTIDQPDDDNTLEPPDDLSSGPLPECDLDAVYQSRLDKCQAMADETLTADRGLPFLFLELPAGLQGDDESQLMGDVACDTMPDIPNNLDGLLGAISAPLSDDGSLDSHLVDDGGDEMDVSAMDLEWEGGMDKSFDILEMLDREANSSAMMRPLVEGEVDDSCHSFNTVQTLVAFDNIEDS